jgi:lambda family phage portal protein
MGVFSRIGSFFSGLFTDQKTETGFFPELNQQPRAYLGSNRGYGGTNSDGSKWRAGLSSSGSSPVLDHQLLLQNGRSAYHDSLQARAIVNRMADTVVDLGLRLEATPCSEILGITREQAEIWSDRVEVLFDLWASSKKSIANETMNFYQAQYLVEIAQQRDNDYFVQYHYDTKRRDLMNPLQISFIDPNQIIGYAFTDTYGIQFDHDGIQRNAKGKEVAYNLMVFENREYKQRVLKAYASNGKRLVSHGFKPEYFNQKRGYSALGHALQEFENITDFTSAQIKKAINQSSIAMYVKPHEENPSSNPFEGVLSKDGAGPLGTMPSDYIGSDPSAAADVPPLDEMVKFESLPEAAFHTPGSVGVFGLQGGEDLKPFQTTAPSESFDKFVNAFTAYLSASHGTPIEVLLMKFGENYSASRATLILFWRIAMIWRAEMAADFLNPVYEEWLSGEIAKGSIQAPGWQDPTLRAAWLNATWLGLPMPNIDPQRTMEADKGYVEMGATTLDKVARDHNGSSGKKNRAKLVREYEELPTPPWAGGNPVPGEAQNNEDEDEDEDDEGEG